LRVLDRNWSEIGHWANLPGEVRTMGRELVDLRHSFAHHATEAADMLPSDAYRHLDTMVRFLIALKTDGAQLKAVEQARMEALTAMAGQLPREQAVKKEESVVPTLPPSAPAVPEVLTQEDFGSVAKEISIGAFKLLGPGDSISTEIASFDGRSVAASAIPWKAVGPQGLEFLIHVVLIDEDADGEFGQVFCESRLRSPTVWDDIVRRLRVGIRRLDDGQLTMDLRVAQRVNGERAAKRMLPLQELDTITGLDIVAVLRHQGATAVGTRADVTGDTGRTRNWPCVKFEANDLTSPAIAYVITTILPMMK